MEERKKNYYKKAKVYSLIPIIITVIAIIIFLAEYIGENVTGTETIIVYLVVAMVYIEFFFCPILSFILGLLAISNSKKAMKIEHKGKVFHILGVIDIILSIILVILLILMFYYGISL